MKLTIFILVLLLFPGLYLRGQNKYIISGNLKDLSFKDFVNKTEGQSAVKFFFKEEWVVDLRLGDYNDCNSIPCVLDNLFRGTSLFYYIDESGNIIITKDFAVSVSQAAITKRNEVLPSSPSDVSEEASGKTENLIIEIGYKADKNKPGNVLISGYVTDEDKREPVAGATVFVQKLSSGTITNQFGFYSLSLPRGIHVIQFTFIGMKEKKINLNLFGSGEMNVEMKSTLIPMKGVIVSAQKNLTLQRFEVGAEKINIASFRLMPTSLGESDLQKSILLIPGVQSVGEGSAGFNVRGGSADQNLILLSGAPVYNSSHFFGFFSAINSDIIKDVTLFKGGIPGRFGGRISSVLDIELKEGNRKEFAGNAGISPITTHLMIEGPFIKDTLTYIFTARTTYK